MNVFMSFPPPKLLSLAISAIATLLCFIPLMRTYKFSTEYENILVDIFGNLNVLLLTEVYSLGAGLPIYFCVVRSLIECRKSINQISLSGLRSRLVLSLVIFLPDVLLMSSSFVTEFAVLADCFLRVRIVWIFWGIIDRLCCLNDSRLILMLAICSQLSGIISLMFNMFTSYVMIPEYANESCYALFVAFGFLGVVILMSIFLRMSYLQNARLWNASEYTCFGYVLGTVVVAVVFLILSMVNHYNHSNIQAAWFMSILVLTRTVVAVVVFLIEDHILQQDEFSKRIVKETLSTQRTFVRLISHEMRTPLNSAYMGLELILAEMVSCRCSDDSLEVLEQVRKACEVSVGMLNDLLSADKLEKGLMQLDKTSVPAFALILDSLSPFFPTANEMGVTLALIPQRQQMAHELKDVILHADKARLCQLFKNILTRSMSVTPRGGIVTVVVNIFSKTYASKTRGKPDRVKKFMKVSITNTGGGILAAEVAHVFTDTGGVPRETGHTSDDDLWVCKVITDLHNAEISVSSEGEGCGCTFTIIFPVISNAVNSRHRLQPRMNPTADASSMYSPPTMRMPADAFDRGHCPSPHRSRAVFSPPPFSDAQIVPVSPMSQVSELMHRSSSTADSKPPDRPAGNGLKDDVCVHSISDIDSSSSLGSDVTVAPLTISRLEADVPMRYGSVVLVVDDSMMNLKMLSRLVSQRCDRVLQAVDGMEAVTAVRQSMEKDQPIDVVLMDFQMPNMDGPTAAKQMREMGYSGLIVGVTGNVLPSDSAMFISKGADKVLFKPIDIHKLDYAIRGLKQRSAGNSVVL